jgi:hypothetical protein
MDCPPLGTSSRRYTLTSQRTPTATLAMSDTIADTSAAISDMTGIIGQTLRGFLKPLRQILNNVGCSFNMCGEPDGWRFFLLNLPGGGKSCGIADHLPHQATDVPFGEVYAVGAEFKVSDANTNSHTSPK